MTGELFLKPRQGGKLLPYDYEGWPASVIVEDPAQPGKIGIQVYDNYISPGGEVAAEAFIALTTLIVGGDMLFLSIELQSWEFFIGAMAGVAAVHYLCRYFYWWLFSSVLWIRIFEDRFEVPEKDKFGIYLTSQFQAITATEPAQAVQEERHERKNPQSDRYFYRNSAIVNLEFTGKTVPLWCVYPRTAAFAVTKRIRGLWDNLGSVIT